MTLKTHVHLPIDKHTVNTQHPSKYTHTHIHTTILMTVMCFSQLLDKATYTCKQTCLYSNTLTLTLATTASRHSALFISKLPYPLQTLAILHQQPSPTRTRMHTHIYAHTHTCAHTCNVISYALLAIECGELDKK